VLRQATMADAVGIWDVRYAVQENTLRRGVIGDEDLRREIEDTGRGWVVDDQGRITAFAIGNAVSGNIWALFVHPDVQGQGHGSRLHDTMVDWLWSRGLQSLWLTTGPLTRARAFYESRGWFPIDSPDATAHGDIRLEMRRP